ncbi:MAG: J domain-containing protein [Dehalococcoidia bacterium]|nr:J domain-containing protein [Dehalococcoidia bacterium]
MAKDYYALLGIKRDASDKDIRQAYRRMARQHHPDVNRGDPLASDRFKEINEAYQVISDPETRRKYDRYGENWKFADRMAKDETAFRRGPSAGTSTRGRRSLFEDLSDVGGAAPSDLGDVLGDFFSRRGAPRSQAMEHPVEVSLEEAYLGTARVVTLTNPDGSTRRLEVKVSPGVDTGSKVRVALDGRRGSELYLNMTVQPHPTFQRKGNDLSTEVTVPLYDALLGGQVQVPTLKGRVLLTIPPETQNGRVFRLAGQGMPVLGQPDGKGDLLVTVKVDLPQGLTVDEADLVRRLKALRP